MTPILKFKTPCGESVEWRFEELILGSHFPKCWIVLDSNEKALFRIYIHRTTGKYTIKIEKSDSNIMLFYQNAVRFIIAYNALLGQ